MLVDGEEVGKLVLAGQELVRMLRLEEVKTLDCKSMDAFDADDEPSEALLQLSRREVLVGVVGVAGLVNSFLV